MARPWRAPGSLPWGLPARSSGSRLSHLPHPCKERWGNSISCFPRRLVSSRKGGREEGPGDGGAPAELLVDLGRPERPARLSLPRRSPLADVCKSLRPHSARTRRGWRGGSDRAWLRAQLRAVEDLGVVEPMASSSPALGTCRRCAFLFFCKCSQEASQQVSGKELAARNVSSVDLRSSASESPGPLLKGPIPGQLPPPHVLIQQLWDVARTVFNKLPR